MDIELKKIRPAPDAINSRKSGELAVKGLVASIKAVGLLQPITVRHCNDGDGFDYELVDGHRRFKAVTKLKWQTVPVHVIDGDDASAAAASLVANIERLPLHPVDQYEAFADMNAMGMDVEQIARTFGITLKQVKGAMALGLLHPVIRKAWRNGDVKEEIARAYTISHDQGAQLAAFRKIGTGYQSTWQVKEELKGDLREMERLTHLVGEEYLAAGGTFTEDLFGEQRYADDMSLLRELAAVKIEQACTELEAHGWPRAIAFNRYAEDDSAKWSYVPGYELEEGLTEKDTTDAVTYGKAVWDHLTEEGKALGIVPVLQVGHDGLHIQWFKPRTPLPLEGVGESGEEVEKVKHPSDISGALTQDVVRWRTLAYRDAFEASPGPLLVLIAAAATSTLNPVFRPTLMLTGKSVPAKHWASIAREVANDGDRLTAQLAVWAQAIDTSGYGVEEDIAELAAMVDRKLLRDALVRHFRAKEFFDRVPRRVVQAMIDEAAVHPVINADKGLVVGTMPLIKPSRTDIASYGERKAVEWGWLPPVLRVLDIDAFPEDLVIPEVKKRGGKRKTVADQIGATTH